MLSHISCPFLYRNCCDLVPNPEGSLCIACCCSKNKQFVEFAFRERDPLSTGAQHVHLLICRTAGLKNYVFTDNFRRYQLGRKCKVICEVAIGPVWIKAECITGKFQFNSLLYRFCKFLRSIFQSDGKAFYSKPAHTEIKRSVFYERISYPFFLAVNLPGFDDLSGQGNHNIIGSFAIKLIKPDDYMIALLGFLDCHYVDLTCI